MKREENLFLIRNKKGLDAVVTTLLIILLSIVAVGIIWVVVKNVISQGASEIDINKFTFDLVIKSAYIDGSNVDVSVRRSAGGGDLVGMKFIFSDGSNSNSVERIGSLDELEQRLFTFNDTEVGGIADVETVSVAPIYMSSNAETIGEVTDTATIQSSPPPGSGGGNVGGQSCGDSVCEGTETAGNCPIDCSVGGQTCGDSVCEGTETVGNCPADCSIGGEVCGDNVCAGGETPGNCPADCSVPSSCNGTWDGLAEDVGVVCDGTPTPNGCSASCACIVGFTADGFGSCSLDPAIDVGVIGNVFYEQFDSANLPKSSITIASYIGNYINFSGSPELSCFQINGGRYVSEEDISYLRVDVTVNGDPNIATGQGYSIWEAANCGQ